MALRVTPAEVAQIYVYDTAIIDAEANVFITAANLLVNIVNTTGGITAAATLKEIERWLSAHFICIRDPQASSEKAGSVGQSLQNKVDLHFNQTRYGQMALLLDTSGTLAALQAQAEGKGVLTASLTSLGPVSDEDADIDR